MLIYQGIVLWFIVLYSAFEFLSYPQAFRCLNSNFQGTAKLAFCMKSIGAWQHKIVSIRLEFLGSLTKGAISDRQFGYRAPKIQEAQDWEIVSLYELKRSVGQNIH